MSASTSTQPRTRKERQLARLEQIQAHFPAFQFTRVGKSWQYTNYPTVKGQRPSLNEIIAHISGATTLRFDNLSDRTRRAPRTVDADVSILPYAVPS